MQIVHCIDLHSVLECKYSSNLFGHPNLLPWNEGGFRLIDHTDWSTYPRLAYSPQKQWFNKLKKEMVHKPCTGGGVGWLVMQSEPLPVLGRVKQLHLLGWKKPVKPRNCSVICRGLITPFLTWICWRCLEKHNTFPQMVVQNGDESYGTIQKKSPEKKQI